MSDWTPIIHGKSIGWGVTGVYEALEPAMRQLKQAVEAGANVYPVFSRAAATTSTRHGQASAWLEAFRAAAGRAPLTDMVAVEPLAPRRVLDLFIVAPCSGATLARLACALTDDPVAFAAKGQLRNARPVLIGLATNDALGLNARNLAGLLQAKHVFFVPFGQDDPVTKPTSVSSDWELVLPAAAEALAGRQLQPLLLGPRLTG
jgi:dipicolinate synthase subunit B